jgi:hypothetical protein
MLLYHEIGLVNQCSGLKGVVCPLMTHVATRQSSQLVVDQGIRLDAAASLPLFTSGSSTVTSSGVRSIYGALFLQGRSDVVGW